MNDYNCKPTCPPAAPSVEVPAIFYRELMPAIKGDETGPEAPYVGKRRNTLLVYEASGAIYLFSSDGNFTFLGYGYEQITKEAVERMISEAVGVEAELRDAADQHLQENIDKKQNILTAGDNITISDDTISAVDTTYTAGENINIDGTTISAVDTTYTAGSGLDLTGTEFSVDTTTIQPKLTAGENIDITGDTISATDTTYTAGSGLDLTGTEFSVDTTTIQPKLTAGTNIDITDDTISATDTTYTAGSGLDLTGTEFSVDTTTIQEKLTAGDNVTISGNTISSANTIYSAGTGLNLNNDEFSVDTTAIQEKLTAGSNITIANDNTISATDTTYSDFTGTNGSASGAAGLVPAPATTDAGKVLKASGNWEALPTIDSAFSDSSTNAVQNKVITTALDRGVVTDMALNANASTTTVSLDETKTNLRTSSTATTSVTLPVASTTQAGVMNSATFDAVTQNTADINALINGAVAVTGLSASPSQSDLTTAWQNATGLTTLMNRAGIYDVTNQKVWTYYTNDTTWHAASNTTQVTINTFTNSSEGTIKGSTNAGQVFAENDGTGSVNGWDTLTNTVGDHTSKLATIAQGAEVNVQSNWTEADSSSDAFILNKPNNLVQDASYVHTDNNFTTALKNKLDGIASGAEVNVQSDLSTTDNTSDTFVKNQFVKRYRTTDSADSYGAGWVYLGALSGNDNGGNKCSIQISGRVGGFIGDSNACTIDLVLANRSKACAVGSIVAPTNFGTQFDIVAYQNTNATTGQQTRWYLRQITDYNSVEVVVRYTTQTVDLWNFTKSTTEPSGVKVYSLAEDIANGGTKVSWYNTTTGNINSMNTVPTSTVGDAINPVYINNGVVTPTNYWTSGHNFNIVPQVRADGVMEIGKYIDFHETADGTEDNTTRLEVLTNSSVRNIKGDFVTKNNHSIEDNATNIAALDAELDDASFIDSTIGTLTNSAYVGTNNIQDGAVTSQKVDWTTFQDSTTERVVGKTSDGRNIYERTFSGNATVTANTRSTIIEFNAAESGQRAKLISVEGYVGVLIGSGVQRFVTPNSEYSGGLGESIAKVWSYAPDQRIMTSAYAPEGGSIPYYIKYRYAKS